MFCAKSKKHGSNKKGFTLIELLVVIAIIALLLSILMPGLQKAKTMAKNVICKTNMHQWSLIWVMFIEENDNKVIGKENVERDLITGSPLAGWDAEAWPEILYDYYESKGVRYCAEAKLKESVWWGDKKHAWHIPSSLTNGILRYAGSYGINDWVFHLRPGKNPPESSWGGGDIGMYWSGPSAPGVDDKVPLFLDCVHIGGIPNAGNRAPEQDMFPFYHGSNLGRFALNRHDKGRTNGLFMDGSARNIGLKELWTLKWHRGFDVNGAYTIAGGQTLEWPEWMRSFKDY